MITVYKLKLYRLYKGDADMFARTGRQEEKQIMDTKGWYLLDTLIQDATVIKRALGSEERILQATERLKNNCENHEVMEEIERLAEIDPKFW